MSVPTYDRVLTLRVKLKRGDQVVIDQLQQQIRDLAYTLWDLAFNPDDEFVLLGSDEAEIRKLLRNARRSTVPPKRTVP